MKKNTLVIAFLFVIGLAFTSCNESKKEESKPEAQKEVSEAKESVEAETPEIAMAEYQCPMQCEGDKTYDEPGKCPKCEMDLKEVKKDSDSDSDDDDDDDDDHDDHDHDSDND